ncbi:hypothetical protein J1614_009568 [Plenodomus biglobosus]|nr:hypothetical protein J1614_009568 [Plenodomus biglobosus]
MIVRFATVLQDTIAIRIRAQERSNMACMQHLSSWLSASEDNSCHHDYAAMFFNVNRFTEALTCAPCLVKSCISDIKAAQAGLQDRGGIFFSKNYGQTANVNGKPSTHRDWTNKWRIAKIRCYNVVQRLEQVRAEDSGEFRECGVHEALKIWEEAKEECCQVPGYHYIVDNPGKNATERTENTQEPKKNIRLDQSGPSELQEHSERLDIDAAVPEPTCLTSAPSLSEEESGMKDVIIDENKCADSPPIPKIRDHSVELSDEGAEHIGTIVPQAPVSQPTAPNTLEIMRSDNEIPLTVTATIASCTSETAHPSRATKPPILRHTRKPAASQSPATQRKVTIDPLVALLPHYGDPSPALIKKYHNSYTTVNKCHKRHCFNRNAGPYQRGTWASPWGYRKVNTSHIGTSWLDYDRLQRDLDEEEAVEKIKASNSHDIVTVTEAPAGVGERQRKLEEFRLRVAMPYGLSRNVNTRRGSMPKTTSAS